MRDWSGDKPLPLLVDQPVAEYTVNVMQVFLRMQWLNFTLTPFSFSLVVQLLFLPASLESAIPLALILDISPSSFFWYGLPYTHSQVGVKVRLLIIFYFNLLIVPQGLGLLSCRTSYI
jgi:hypothetical protein